MKKFLLLGCGVLILCVLAIFMFKNTEYVPSLPKDKTEPQHVNWTAHQIDKVEVYKAKREVRVLEKGHVLKVYKMRLGFTPLGHKTTEGDGKTPEGKYVLDWRNPNSQFYKSIHVSYPNQQDQAQASARNVSPGGDIMIHGSAKKLGGAVGEPLYNYMPKGDWTWGCIAVSNQDMDELWDNIKNGTPIEIFP